ncbi:MAG: DUF1559 domain-containing protein [Planctomycetota bacterium]
MRDELLAYLLNDLDENERSRVEQRLEVDPIWQHELERLRRYVEEAQQAESFQEEHLPADLVNRTCSFVQKASSQGTLSPAVLPTKLSESQDAAAPQKKRWTIIDFAVVASILTIMATLLVPAIRDSRESARRLQCQENLRTLGIALTHFARQNHGRLPSIGQHENAGIFAVKLLESRVISPDELCRVLICPSGAIADEEFGGADSMRVPTRQELQQAAFAQLQHMLQRMGGSYAFRFGFYGQQGQYRQVKFTGSSSEPMMADKPSYEVAGFQSPHHGTCGQNVLFQDGSVHYVQICIQTGPDKHWFLNEEKEHAAGTHRSDIVMGRSEASPSGTITLIDNRQRLPMRSAP